MDYMNSNCDIRQPENYIFDLYGTLIDSENDEHSIFTWLKWCKYLDKKGIKHPRIFTFRKDFFEADRLHRVTKKQEMGCKVPEIDIILVYRELFERYGNGRLEDEFLNELSYEFRVASRKYIKLYPGVTEYLEKIRREGRRIYILSNAQRSYTWPEIEMFNLHKLTDDQLLSSDYGVMKPDEMFYRAIIEKYNLDKSATIMHGDNFASDCEGAMAAGIGYVHLANDNRPEIYFRR